MDVKEAAIAVGALFEGTVRLWVYDPDTVKFDQHIEIGTQRLLEGLRTPDATWSS